MRTEQVKRMHPQPLSTTPFSVRAAGDAELLWIQCILFMEHILVTSLRPSWFEAEGGSPPVVAAWMKTDFRNPDALLQAVRVLYAHTLNVPQRWPSTCPRATCARLARAAPAPPSGAPR